MTSDRIIIDKRRAAQLMRDRLTQLMTQSAMTQGAFAQSLGIDRSALSQILSGNAHRLPRAETLIALGQRYRVSVDWLLGLTEDRGATTEALNTVETEQALDSEHRTAMERWHEEVGGQKIRYVPLFLPDLMRTPAVIAFQAQRNPQETRRLHRQTDRRLSFSRMPEADIECCMPYQTLEAFAHGQGVWSDLPIRDRLAQLDHIAQTLDELYPSFRLYLFDGLSGYLPPMTIFGYRQAAVYAGELYFLMQSKPLVQDLVRLFDQRIRQATHQAHAASDHVRGLSQMLA